MSRNATGTATTRLTQLILEVFTLNNRLLTSGDRLVGQLGLSSTRWQVLGFIIENERTQPVAWIAREMGAYRQNIQRIVNELVVDGLLQFAPNPHHRRAHLVVPTDKGVAAHKAALQVQRPWAEALASGISDADLEIAHRVVTTLRERLERTGDRDARENT